MQTERALPRALALGLWLALGLALAYGAFRGGTEAPRRPRATTGAAPLAVSSTAAQTPVASEPARGEPSAGASPDPLSTPIREGLTEPPLHRIEVRDAETRELLPRVVVHGVRSAKTGPPARAQVRRVLDDLAAGGDGDPEGSWLSTGEGTIAIAGSGWLLWTSETNPEEVRWGCLRIEPWSAGHLTELLVRAFPPLQVRVLDAADEPASGVTVALRRSSPAKKRLFKESQTAGRTVLSRAVQGTTDATGLARFPWAGPILEIVGGDWNVAVESRTELVADQALDRDETGVRVIRLPESGELRVQLVDREGRPISRDCAVELTRLAPTFPRQRSLGSVVATDGVAVFPLLPLGERYRILTCRGFPVVEVQGPRLAGEVVEKQLFESQWLLTGLVVDETGSPVGSPVRAAWLYFDGGGRVALDARKIESAAGRVRIQDRRLFQLGGLARLELELADGRAASLPLTLPVRADASDVGEVVARKESLLAVLSGFPTGTEWPDVPLRVSILRANDTPEWQDLEARRLADDRIEVLGPPLEAGVSEVDLLVGAEGFGWVRLHETVGVLSPVRLVPSSDAWGAVLLPPEWGNEGLEVRASRTTGRSSSRREWSGASSGSSPSRRGPGAWSSGWAGSSHRSTCSSGSGWTHRTRASSWWTSAGRSPASISRWSTARVSR